MKKLTFLLLLLPCFAFAQIDSIIIVDSPSPNFFAFGYTKVVLCSYRESEDLNFLVSASGKYPFIDTVTQIYVEGDTMVALLHIFKKQVLAADYTAALENLNSALLLERAGGEVYEINQLVERVERERLRYRNFKP